MNAFRDPKKHGPFKAADIHPFMGPGRRSGIPIRADNIEDLKALVPKGRG